ncbi:MAG TPA: ATP-binding cassette domain-containing protein [Sedimentisphaerales bacterium]|nr:ATP-binding cassette domain-containing protein [Sedimentisphaerales bacterium]HNU28399.1 ATP-binding cassette domain-containing protein [Sedimentisphaerales bacterium]
MSRLFVRFHDVTFAYPSAAEPLFSGLSLHLPCGWSGVVGANGAGKTTFLKLATRQLAPEAGVVEAPPRVAYCPQRTDDAPATLKELIDDRTGPARSIGEMLGVQPDWPDRWQTLSHGERKRAQIAVALWLEPDVLAVDEPTNHLDTNAKNAVVAAMRSFDGVGLLVSHDRELLDSLCGQCVFLDPPDVTVRPGGVTKGMEVADMERQAASRQHEQDRRECDRIRREAARREQLAAAADRRRSKRGLGARDHDARGKKNLARVTSKDAVGGTLRRQIGGQLERAQRKSQTTRVKKQYETGIWLAGSTSKRNTLLDLPAGAIVLGEHRSLRHPDLTIRPTDRIALTGANGSGKSTLVRRIIAILGVPTEQQTYVPQEIDASRSQELLDQARQLAADQLGHLMNIVSRLGSRPERLLVSDEPSPGETRKLMLALGMVRAPHIIVMDEPTNHMDLPSIEALETALVDCPCALLLVSHDTRFLQRLTRTTWHITQEPDAGDVLTLCIT